MDNINRFELIEGNDVYVITEYPNGNVEKVLKQVEVLQPIPAESNIPTLEDKVNFLYYKELGVI